MSISRQDPQISVQISSAISVDRDVSAKGILHANEHEKCVADTLFTGLESYSRNIAT